MRPVLACVLALARVLACTAPAAAEEIRGQPNARVAAALDILRADIRVEQAWALFSMELRGPPGGAGARPAGAARGARVAGNTIDVRVPFADLAVLRGARFDGFTAELRLAAQGTVPLLCVASPIDSASGTLSLPGLIR